MLLSLKTAPTEQPLDWEGEVKGHLRLDDTTPAAERDRIEGLLIPAAQEIAQAETERQLLTATWTLYLDEFPADGEKIELPKPPLQSVTSVKYLDTAGTLTTWAAAGNYTVLAPAGAQAEPGYILPAYGVPYPTTQDIESAVQIEFICGYGTTYVSVPGAIRAALLLLVGEMYAHRETSVVGTIITELPIGARRLLWPFRVWR